MSPNQLSRLLSVFSPNSMLNLIVLLVGLGVVQLVSTVAYRLYFHPLRNYPGPRSSAISQVPLIRESLAGNIVKRQLDLHRKYGKVVRIGPNELSFTEANFWSDVCAYRKGHEEFGKSPLVIIKPPNGVAGILGADRMNHRRFRKQLSGSFSERAMREQQPVIMKYVDLLVERLKDRAGKEPQDLVRWFNWATFDIIGVLAFGESFQCLEKARIHPGTEAVFGNVKSSIAFSALKRFGIDRPARYLLPKKVVEQKVKNIRFWEDKIKSRISKGHECGDFWDSVLKHKDEEDMMTLQEMTSNASNLVLGGSETTATLLSGTIYLLLRHPRVMHKVVSELHQQFLSADDIDLFTVGHLKYTLAVLNETMRIYPPVPEQAARTVPVGGDTVDGKYLPEGTTIHIYQYVVNRLPSNFKRPEEFIPERFLGDEEFKNDNFDVFQPFSVGPRNCIGKNLAYAEMRLLLAKVLWNLEFELVDNTVDWLDQKVFILWEKHPLMVHVKERQRTTSR